MRIKNFFTKKANTKTESRADRLSKHVPEDILGMIKGLKATEIKDLIRQFVPLDFFVLLQKYNPSALNRALAEVIEQNVSREPFPQWIAELQMEPKEAVNEVIAAMYSNDPDKAGEFISIKQRGSHYKGYNYSQQENPQLKASLWESLSPLDSDIVVPHCPSCQKVGINHPLWSLSKEKGKIEIVSGLKNGKCTQYEEVLEGPKSELEKIILDPDSANLPEDVIGQLDQGLRELKIKDGKLVAECTFKAILPAFSNFIQEKSKAIMRTVLDPERKRLGKQVAPADLDRLRVLEGMERIKTLSPEEEKELKKLREKIQSKSKDLVGPAISTTAPIGSDGDNKRTVEDVLRVEQEDSQSREEAVLNLKKFLGDEDFKILEFFAENTSLISLLGKVKKLMTLSSKDPGRSTLEQSAKQEAYNLALKLQDKLASGSLEVDESDLDQVSHYAVSLRSSIERIFDDEEMEELFEKFLESYGN